MKDHHRLPCGRMIEDKETLISELNLTSQERVLLRVARYFFQNFCAPQNLAWMSAFAEVQKRFGPEKGPKVASRLMDLLSAFRLARKSVFRFNNPLCEGCAVVATEHERRLMCAISYAKSGRNTLANTELMMLCEGNDLSGVTEALSDLVTCLNGIDPTVQVATHSGVSQ